MDSYFEVLPVYLHVLAIASASINLTFGLTTRGIFNIVTLLDNIFLVLTSLLIIGLCFVLKWWFGPLFAFSCIILGAIINGILLRFFEYHIHAYIYSYRIVTLAFDAFIIYSIIRILVLNW